MTTMGNETEREVVVAAIMQALEDGMRTENARRVKTTLVLEAIDAAGFDIVRKQTVRIPWTEAVRFQRVAIADGADDHTNGKDVMIGGVKWYGTHMWVTDLHNKRIARVLDDKVEVVRRAD